MQTTIANLKNYVGEEVSVKCWIFNSRFSGKIGFLQLRDGSGFTQGIVEDAILRQAQHDTNFEDESSLDENGVFDIAKKLTDESSVEITGVVSKHPKKDEYEIQVSGIKPIHISSEYPIGKKEHGPDFLFENRDLYLRSKTPWAVLRIRDQVFRSITNYFHEQGFIRFDTPVLQPTNCEDSTQLFGLQYYDSMMYLTQSGQLYLEAGIMGFGKAYDFGPVFRAEKSKTRNHLSEFWMMDAEMAFYDQQMNEDVQEGLVKRIISDTLEFCKPELEILERDTTILEKCVNEKFIRIKHFDAKTLCKDVLKLENVDCEGDMTTEEEIQIGNYFGIPVFIEDYPMAVKSFYMKRYIDERGTLRVSNADLIAPEEAREIIGGSQREDNYQTLYDEIVSRNYSLQDYEWYLNIRRYGSVPHSGFGLGLERTVRWITGVHHIRETIPFPRTTVLSRP